MTQSLKVRPARISLARISLPEVNMRILTAALIFLFSLASWAAPQAYRIETQLFIDGKLISTPRIGTILGEEASIKQTSEDDQHMEMKVTAKEQANSMVLIKVDFDYSNGSQTIKATPHLLANAGEEATVEVGEGALENGYKLVVKATPQ
jgi:hypothetical protein